MIRQLWADEFVSPDVNIQNLYIQLPAAKCREFIKRKNLIANTAVSRFVEIVL